jgi:hypothetical protein
MLRQEKGTVEQKETRSPVAQEPFSAPLECPFGST